jgi:hypothetical protein
MQMAAELLILRAARAIGALGIGESICFIGKVAPPVLKVLLNQEVFLGQVTHSISRYNCKVRQLLSFPWPVSVFRAPKIPVFLAKTLAIKGAFRYARVGEILVDFKGAGLYPLQMRLAEFQARTLVVWGLTPSEPMISIRRAFRNHSCNAFKDTGSLKCITDYQ